MALTLSTHLWVPVFGENGKRQAKHIECPSKPPWNSPHDFDETTATLTTTVTVLQSPPIVTSDCFLFKTSY